MKYLRSSKLNHSESPLPLFLVAVRRGGISGKLHFRRKNWELQSQYNTQIKVNTNNPPKYKTIPICNVLQGFKIFYFFNNIKITLVRRKATHYAMLIPFSY